MADGDDAGRRLARLLIGVLLVRILTPTDFGTMALALVVHGFAATLWRSRDGPMRPCSVPFWPAAVRARAAFTMSVLLGLVVSGAVTLGGPLSAVEISPLRN